MRALIARASTLLSIVALLSCGGDKDATTAPGGSTDTAPCVVGSLRGALQMLGCGLDTTRYTAEIAVRGNTAYTTTWGNRRASGNKINIWDVTQNSPVLVDSVIVTSATTLGDIQISDDGKLLVVATEFSPGSMVVFDLTDPRKPQQIARFSNDQTAPGVHTAKLGRVNGKLYAFLSVDPTNDTFKAREVIVDLSAPSAPVQASVSVAGLPYVHDTYLRDGLLFVALWNDGMQIWDLGGGGMGGTPESPVVMGTVQTVNGNVHNIWWYHDASGGKKFAFVGEEGSGVVGSTSRGDIHIVDVSDLMHPKEVAFYSVPTAGTHNFSVDEKNGVLYAAYYNGGVRAIDVRGDLGTCAVNQQIVTQGLSRCALHLMGRELAVGLLDQPRTVYVWGVQYTGSALFASDMLNGIWRLQPAK
ncbi:MAG TPA: hypothetical protein VGM50_23290 [Gemmatimonadaceae bacterium]|jgi:hypothetical protein